MYCGDETGAFVGDCGNASCRFGYGGEDIPKLVLPSYVGDDDGSGVGSSSSSFVVGDNALGRYRPNLDLRYIYRQKSEVDECIPPTPTSMGGNDADNKSRSGGIGGTVMTDGSEYYGDGCIDDYDAYEATWERAFVDLRVRDKSKWTSPSTVSNGKHRAGELDRACPHPVCAVEAGHTCYGPDTPRNFGQKQRERLTELLFEKFDAPAIFVAPSPILSAFGVGRQTGLVVDVGGGGCRATPVIDGLMCKNAQRRSGRGGEWLSDCAYRILKGCGGDDGGGVEIHPRYAVGLARGDGEEDLSSSSLPPSPDPRPPGRKRAKTSSEPSSSEKKGGAKGDASNEEDVEKQPPSAAAAPSAATSQSAPSSSAPRRKVVRYPDDLAGVTPSFHRKSVREVLYEIKTGFHVSTPHQQPTSSSSSPGGGRASPRASPRPRPSSRNDDSDGTGTGTGGGGGGTGDDDDDSDGDGSSSSAAGGRQYELPDGTRVDLRVGGGASRLCTLPELHFEDLNVQSSAPTTASASASGGGGNGGGDGTLLGNSDWTRTLSTLPLHRMAHEALSQTDVDARKELCGNIILCGAGSLHDGFERRLSREMSDACPTSYRCRVIAARPIERRFSSWIGASVLTSLGSFQQLWLSRAEYEEYGASMGCQRFP